MIAFANGIFFDWTPFEIGAQFCSSGMPNFYTTIAVTVLKETHSMSSFSLSK